GANTANAQKSQSFFQPIEGFDEVSADDATEDLTLSGLEVVDDTTFTVKLVSAQADFSSRLGYSAYSPLPDSAYEDIDGFGEKPVGNGPYMVDSWAHDSEIVLVPNPEYDGPRVAQNAGITFVIYAEDETLYNDMLSGNVDVSDIIPTSALSTFEDGLGERAGRAPRPAGQRPGRGVPVRHHPAGRPGLLRRGRQAAPPGAVLRDRPQGALRLAVLRHPQPRDGLRGPGDRRRRRHRHPRLRGARV